MKASTNTPGMAGAIANASTKIASHLNKRIAVREQGASLTVCVFLSWVIGVWGCFGVSRDRGERHHGVVTA
jgi:hypothetical protein